MIDIVTFGEKLPQALDHLLENKGDRPSHNYRIIYDPKINQDRGEEFSFDVWLSHIISHYDTLSDFTLFLTNKAVENTLFKDEIQLLSVLEIEPSLFCDRTQWCKVIKCDQFGAPHHPGLLIKQWYQKLFPEMSPPAIFVFVQGGQCIKSKERIRKKNVEFYKMLLDALRGGSVSHHVLERLWGYL